MVLLSRIVFSVITLALAGYGLLTQNYEYQSFMMLFLGLTVFTMGIQEFQNNRKKMGGWLMAGCFLILSVSLFNFIVS